MPMIPVKEAMNQMGMEVGGYRLPLCEILREGTGEGYCWNDMT